MKVIFIVIIVLILVAGFLSYQYWWLPQQKTKEGGGTTLQEKSCLDSGGSISTSLCCKTAADFPNTCTIDACGCSADNSHQVKICNCGTDKCFNGNKCTNIAVTKDNTSGWKTYKNSTYNFELKYPNNWYYHISDFSEVKRQMICFNPQELSEDDCSVPLIIDWDNLLESMYNTAKNNFQKDATIKESTLSVGGVQAKVIDVTAQTGIIKTIFFEKNDVVYNFAMEAGHESYFGNMVSSFKFNEVKVINGFIEGSLSYPSEFIPEDMVICAENTITKKSYCAEEHLDNDKYTYKIGYKIEVPAGEYLVYAYLPDDKDYKAYYSEFVTCGFDIKCPSHEPIKVTVQANKTSANIDPQDWYNQ
ncbi:MAG: hypothetical protein V1841_00545 [Patescibacteria group bacterium]